MATATSIIEYKPNDAPETRHPTWDPTTIESGKKKHPE